MYIFQNFLCFFFFQNNLKCDYSFQLEDFGVVSTILRVRRTKFWKKVKTTTLTPEVGFSLDGLI